MMTQKRMSAAMLVLAAVLLVAGGVQAQVTTTWTGGTSTDWNTAANWNNGVPGENDDVVVPDTTTKPTMPAGRYPATGRFGSFTVQSGAIVTCQGDPTVTNEDSGGTDVSADTKHGIGVSIFATSATIDGILDANVRGFPNNAGPGRPSSAGPGAAHGGRASSGSNPTYGQIREPTALGSGAQNNAGGGAIRLNVIGALTLNGTIRANGGSSWGPSSGGSIWLEAGTFAGDATGAVQALGGSNTSGVAMGAGGGRIAVVSDVWTYDGTISASGGLSQFHNMHIHRAQSGSLWAPSMPIDFSGDMVVTANYQYHFPDDTPRSVDSLTITGNAWFEVHGGDLTIGNLVISNGIFRYDRFAYNDATFSSAMSNLTITGSVTVAEPTESGNNVHASLWLPVGEHQVGHFLIATNANLNVPRSTVIVNEFSGGTASNPHGRGVLLRCEDATIHGNIWTMAGYSRGTGPGNNSQGAAHGGRGRDTSPPYGRMLAPTALGSGGGSTGGGGSGGGSVALLASGDMILNGSITADAPAGSFQGAGSGGSIWLTARTLTGSGALFARGGGVDNNTTHGGGGRIAIEAGTDLFTGTIDVSRGSHANHPTDIPQTGTVFRATGVVRNLELDGVDGRRLETTLQYAANDRLLVRNIAQWGNTMEWTDTAKRFSNDSNDTNAADYLMSGFLPNQGLTVYVNDVQDLSLTEANGSGELLIASVALAPTAIVRVEIPPAGTVIFIK